MTEPSTAAGIDVERTDFVGVPVRDIERAVKFYGVCHMAFFNDPDGNALMLHRRYAPYGDGSTP